MTFVQLRYFLGVVEHGGFAKAATKLFVAQSALSTQIKKLEQELGAPLLTRHVNGPQLTPAGKLLVRHAQAIQAQALSCKREIEDLATGGGRGLVRLGISPSLSKLLTMPVLRAAQARWPGMSLHIREALTAEIEDGLATGDLDVGAGLRWADGTEQPDEVLRPESLYVVSPSQPGGRIGKPVRASKLHEIPLVVTTQRYALRRFIDGELAKLGRKLRVEFELDSLEQTMQMVVAGEASTLMLSSMCVDLWKQNVATLRHVEGLAGTPQIFVAESRVSGNRASGMVKKVVQAVAQELHDNGTWPRFLHQQTRQEADWPIVGAAPTSGSARAAGAMRRRR